MPIVLHYARATHLFSVPLYVALPYLTWLPRLGFPSAPNRTAARTPAITSGHLHEIPRVSFVPRCGHRSRLTRLHVDLAPILLGPLAPLSSNFRSQLVVVAFTILIEPSVKEGKNVVEVRVVLLDGDLRGVSGSRLERAGEGRT